MKRDADRTVIHYRYLPTGLQAQAGKNGTIACNFGLRTSRSTIEQEKVTCKNCKRIVGIL